LLNTFLYFSSFYAKQKFIQGENAEKKGIKLARHLVENRFS